MTPKGFKEVKQLSLTKGLLRILKAMLIAAFLAPQGEESISKRSMDNVFWGNKMYINPTQFFRKLYWRIIN
jgi:hypothetical protein